MARLHSPPLLPPFPKADRTLWQLAFCPVCVRANEPRFPSNTGLWHLAPSHVPAIEVVLPLASSIPRDCVLSAPGIHKSSVNVGLKRGASLSPRDSVKIELRLVASLSPSPQAVRPLEREASHPQAWAPGPAQVSNPWPSSRSSLGLPFLRGERRPHLPCRGLRVDHY